MPVSYTKVVENIYKNTYEFVFSFEHGDADFDESYSVFFEDMNENQLINYVKKSEEISDMIVLKRQGEIELPKNFEQTAKSENFYIPVELDNYAKMHMNGYYAASGISKIFYYDEYGQKFKVNVE